MAASGPFQLQYWRLLLVVVLVALIVVVALSVGGVGRSRTDSDISFSVEGDCMRECMRHQTDSCL
jgi:hypothetical protein